MKWKPYRYDNPDESGAYVVTLERYTKRGNVSSNYVAFWDGDKGFWYKYDPFDDDYLPKEKITDRVLTWVDNMSTYNG